MDKFFDKTSINVFQPQIGRGETRLRKKPRGLQIEDGWWIPTLGSSVAQDKRNPSLLPTKHTAVIKENLRHSALFCARSWGRDSVSTHTWSIMWIPGSTHCCSLLLWIEEDRISLRAFNPKSSQAINKANAKVYCSWANVLGMEHMI